MQELVDETPQAVLYYSDDFSMYSALIYKPGIHIALTDKSQTFHVEGGIMPKLSRSRHGLCIPMNLDTPGGITPFPLKRATISSTNES
jgi:hypothetical protein